MAWRPLGYIFDTSIYQSKNQRESLSMKSLKKADQLHRIFDCILNSYIGCQRAGGVHDFKLQIGGSIKM